MTLRPLILAAITAAFFIADDAEAGHFVCDGQPCHWRNYSAPTRIYIGDNLPPEYDIALVQTVNAWNAGQDEYDLIIEPGTGTYGETLVPPFQDCVPENAAAREFNRWRINICRKDLGETAHLGEAAWLPTNNGHIWTGWININGTTSRIIPPPPDGSWSQAQNTICHEIGHAAFGLNHAPSPCDGGAQVPDPINFTDVVTGAHGGDCADFSGATYGQPDGYVDTRDIAYVNNYFGLPSPPSPWQADTNNSRFIDSVDISEVTNQFGLACA